MDFKVKTKELGTLTVPVAIPASVTEWLARDGETVVYTALVNAQHRRIASTIAGAIKIAGATAESLIEAGSKATLATGSAAKKAKGAEKAIAKTAANLNDMTPDQLAALVAGMTPEQRAALAQIAA